MLLLDIINKTVVLSDYLNVKTLCGCQTITHIIHTVWHPNFNHKQTVWNKNYLCALITLILCPYFIKLWVLTAMVGWWLRTLGQVKLRVQATVALHVLASHALIQQENITTSSVCYFVLTSYWSWLYSSSSGVSCNSFVTKLSLLSAGSEGFS